MRPAQDKPGSANGLTAAIVFAAIVVAVAGSARASAGMAPGHPCAALSSVERTRLIAAAVAATRDLLGVERPVVALPVIRAMVAVGDAPAIVRPQRDGPLRPEIMRLPPRLTSLPPPIC